MNDLSKSVRSDDVFDEATTNLKEPPRLVQPPPLPPPIAKPAGERNEESDVCLNDPAWKSLAAWASLTFVQGAALLVALFLLSPSGDTPSYYQPSLAVGPSAALLHREEIEWVEVETPADDVASTTLVGMETVATPPSNPDSDIDAIQASVVASALTVDSILTELEEPDSTLATTEVAWTERVSPVSIEAPKSFVAAAPACADGKCRIPAAAPACDADNDRQHGTLIEWAGSPDEAARIARREGKLLMLLQVSGNFARVEFT